MDTNVKDLFQRITERPRHLSEASPSFVDIGLEGELFYPSSEPHYLSERIEIVRRSSGFIVAEERDVTLTGFRLYSTSDGFYFVDESVYPTFSYQDFLTKLMSGDHENLSIRDGFFYNEGQACKIDEPVISLASHEPSNYGSWIYRIIPKLSTLDFRKHPVLVYQNSKWMGEALKLMFGEELRIIPHWPAQNYLIKQALVPSQRNLDVLFDLSTKYFYRGVAARVKGRSLSEKIYLSRAKQGLRRLCNEHELEQFLMERGFLIIHPENLSLEDQIRVIRDARVIVCPGGSGLFSSVFASSAEIVVDLEPGQDWLYAHHNLLRSLGIRHCVIFGQRLDASEPHSDWKVNIDHLRKALLYAGAW